MKNKIMNALTILFVCLLIFTALAPSDWIFNKIDTLTETQQIVAAILLCIVAIPWFMWLRDKIQLFEKKKRE